jgi:hypothetical protein
MRRLNSFGGTTGETCNLLSFKQPFSKLRSWSNLRYRSRRNHGADSKRNCKEVKVVQDVKVLEQIKKIKATYEKGVVEATGSEMSWEEFLKDIRTGLGLREVCS